jgi:protein gp37
MPNYWNPWHGCIKISPGCKYCYVYRQDAMYGSEISSSEVRKNADFNLPLKRKRDKSYKLGSGQIIYTCLTSDFFVDKADEWRAEAWAMIKLRKDLRFFIFTKRIDRFLVNLPEDWGDGYENVIIGCTVENQDRADYRLPIFHKLPIKHKVIIIAPMLEKMDISAYLNDKIEEVATSGESGREARILDYDWILDIRRQCVEKNIPFSFHQTGAKLRKDGKVYYIQRRYQISQAYKANIDYNPRQDFEVDFKHNVSTGSTSNGKLNFDC